eukprot:TRINITY_DN1562_c0_g1_i5.p2 TRINITY_DN1562_c0_g1~~TRINITY_DN1562_c0_g1_i5.p2  ORF type:complete len:146 (-),score=52.79 TRINITY_DN1562_c0_g1_i5:418-855(-)
MLLLFWSVTEGQRLYCGFFFFFFFQAEDGIRDVERSRGLGDVYKRQVSTQSTWDFKMEKEKNSPQDPQAPPPEGAGGAPVPVSNSKTIVPLAKKSGSLPCPVPMKKSLTPKKELSKEELSKGELSKEELPSFTKHLQPSSSFKPV